MAQQARHPAGNPRGGQFKGKGGSGGGGGGGGGKLEAKMARAKAIRSATNLAQLDRAIYGDKGAAKRWSSRGGPPSLYD